MTYLPGTTKTIPTSVPLIEAATAAYGRQELATVARWHGRLLRSHVLALLLAAVAPFYMRPTGPPGIR